MRMTAGQCACDTIRRMTARHCARQAGATSRVTGNKPSLDDVHQGHPGPVYTEARAIASFLRNPTLKERAACSELVKLVSCYFANSSNVRWDALQASMYSWSFES